MHTVSGQWLDTVYRNRVLYLEVGRCYTGKRGCSRLSLRNNLAIHYILTCALMYSQAEKATKSSAAQTAATTLFSMIASRSFLPLSLLSCVSTSCSVHRS